MLRHVREEKAIFVRMLPVHSLKQLIWSGVLCCLFFSVNSFAQSVPGVSHISGLQAAELLSVCRTYEPNLNQQKALILQKDLQWKPVKNIPVNIGFTSQECWFKTHVTNYSEQTLQLILSAGYSLLERADLLIADLDATVVFDHQQAGTHIPFHKWAVQNHTPAFNLALPASEGRTLIWILRSPYSIQFDAKIFVERKFYENQETMLLLHALFFGAMLVMIIYNALLYIGIRDKVYILYCFWASAMTAFQFIYLGFAQRFLWGDGVAMSGLAMAILLPIIIIFGPWFARVFLDLKRVSPRDDQVLKGISMSGGVLLASLLVLDRYLLVPICTIVILTMAISILIICARRLRSRDQSAIYFIVAWSCLIVGITIMALNKLAIIPLSGTDSLVELGTFLEVTLLSLALAERIKVLKQESEKSKADRAIAELEAAKARELSQSKSEFLAAMSHEIRTPMNGVLSMADILRKEKLPPEPLSYVETIFQSTQSLLKVINDILDFSRIESGKLEIETVDTDIEQMVDECVQLFAIQSRQKNIALIASIDKDLPQIVQLDPIRVKQIINNFLSNAFKFTDEGSIRLSLYPSRSNNEKDSCFVIEVEDTGVGLSVAEQSRLFQAFSQADRTISRRFGGSGLGLTICKNLAELMNGNITMLSKKGEGTCIQVVLPLRAGRSSEETLLNGKRILISEPDQYQLNAYKHMCERWGMEVLPVSCGEIAQEEQSKCADVAMVNNHCVRDCDIVNNNEIVLPLVEVGQHQKFPIANSSQACLFLHEPVGFQELKSCLIKVLALTESNGGGMLQESESHDWKGLNVLVAEDNSVNQVVILRMLKKFGIKAKVVENGALAVEACAQSNTVYDIVFMDCDMPVMDGYEATAKIRNSYSHVVGSVIGLSANAANEQVQKALDIGMDDYITKPVTLQALKEALERAGQRRSGWANDCVAH